MSSLLSLPEISCPDSCHICEDGKPRWYCAADEAYLCDDCDISVHGMNSLALMHERLVLDCSSGYNELAQKVPCSAPGTKDDVNIKHASSSMYDSYNNIKGSVQKLKKDFSSDERQAMTCTDQTSGFLNFGDITYTRSTNVKQLKSKSESPDEHELPYEFNAGRSEWKALENRLSVHEVPVLIPVAQEMHSISFDQEEADPKQACSSFLGASLVDDSSTCNFMEYLVPEFCDADSSIISSIDHVSYSEEEASAVNAKQASTDVYGYVRERICHELQGNKGATIEFSFPNKSPQNILQEYDRYYDRNTNDLLLEYLELNVLKRSEKPKAIPTEMFVPLAWVCEKMKVESNGETDHINQHLEALIKRPFHIITTEVGNQQSFLSLNYEDILSAWSDRGCFWTDGQKHMAVSLHDSSSSSLEEANLDVGIVPELEPETTKPPYQQKETAFLCASTEDGGREARVLRYREKRRTRLFSKKIRYEVRKLNAEKRPRVKGRFVKRS